MFSDSDFAAVVASSNHWPVEKVAQDRQYFITCGSVAEDPILVIELYSFNSLQVR